MASLLVKNIPPELRARLKQRAANNRRSLNSETILVLEQAVAPNPSAADAAAPGLGKLPPEIAARLRALNQLQDSLAARKVDFDQWRKDIRGTRR